MPASSTPAAAPPPIDQAVPEDTRTAAFALGCFWRPDALFGAAEGVVRTCVGYAGGEKANPTYDALGDHIETVRVTYDPSRVRYADLLEGFWNAHDPTRAPFKRQYQSALFPRTEAQRETAARARAAVADRLDATLSTEIIPGASVHRAEPYHQKHKLRRHPDLMAHVRAWYASDEAFADAPATALLNGYVGGERAPRHLDDDLPRLGLDDEAAAQLRETVEQRHA